MLSPLLATKFHMPPASPNLVPRPHLVQALDDALRRPQELILVSAPAGFGKSTLVADWLRRASLPAAWLSLDRDDNVPARFWRYLVAALQTVDAAIGRAVRAALEAPQLPPLEPLVAALIEDLARAAQPVILVLDDYHLIEAEPIHAILGFLLDHLPPSLRLVIITRVDPPLALARRRGRGQLMEARTSDLRFTVAEAAEFFNTCMGLDLPAEDVETLEHRTEGWIVGLQLAALSLKRQADRHAFVNAFAGDDRYVIDYLLEEVLQQQTPQINAFLLQTSILERLCAPLCAAVTGESDSQAILTYLEQANLFLVPLDNRRYWYRYHHLFADLLRRRLGQAEPPADRLALYRRASAWYESEGFITEAVAQALVAPDFELAADLMERHVLAIFFRSETMLVHGWLKALPEAVLRGRPLLCAVYANTTAHMGAFQPRHLKQTEYWLQEAERALADAASLQGMKVSIGRPGNDLVRGFIALSRAYLALWRQAEPGKTVELALQALAGLPPVDEMPSDPNYLRFRSALSCNLGLSYLRLGDEVAANRAFTEARQVGETCGDLLNAYAAVTGQCQILRWHGCLPEIAALCREALASIGGVAQSTPPVPYAGTVYVALGQVLLEWNDLESAEFALDKGLALSKLTAITQASFEGSVSLARLRQARRDAAGAYAALEQAGRDWPLEVDTIVEAGRVRLWLIQSEEDPHRLDPAVRWAQGRRLGEGRDEESLTLARVLIARRRAVPHPPVEPLPGLDPLLQFLEGRLQASEARGWLERTIELLILQAMARQAQDDTPGALDSLRRALILAQPGGYIRMFVDEGRPMRELLSGLRSALEKESHDHDLGGPSSGTLLDYAARLLSAFRAEFPVNRPLPAGGGLVEPVFPRELEVLRLVAGGASNAEIARKLFISVNTVKKHLTNIFGKLGAANRAEAVARARELRLLA